mmetsp:Transcript_20822/g.59698  ORF Transcript_20822/g.59698 Transcript_20822/m.59698 type:complete len:236 (+) Transcript_20822:1997-2704(+)
MTSNASASDLPRDTVGGIARRTSMIVLASPVSMGAHASTKSMPSGAIAPALCILVPYVTFEIRLPLLLLPLPPDQHQPLLFRRRRLPSCRSLSLLSPRRMQHYCPIPSLYPMKAAAVKMVSCSMLSLLLTFTSRNTRSTAIAPTWSTLRFTQRLGHTKGKINRRQIGHKFALETFNAWARVSLPSFPPHSATTPCQLPPATSKPSTLHPTGLLWITHRQEPGRAMSSPRMNASRS